MREYQPACMVVARKPLRLLYGAGGSRFAFPVGKSIMAHPPRGSVQTERVRLPYDAPASRSRIFFKVQPMNAERKRGKGG